MLLVKPGAISKHQPNMQVCALLLRVVFGTCQCCPSDSPAACFSGSNAQRDMAFHGLLCRRRCLVRFFRALMPIFLS